MGLLSMFGLGDDDAAPPRGLLGNTSRLAQMSPIDRALLAAGATALEAGGPSLRPSSSGQILGQMVNAGLGAYDKAQDADLDRGIMGLKVQGMQQEMAQQQAALERESRIRQRIAQSMRGGQGMAGYGADQSSQAMPFAQQGAGSDRGTQIASAAPGGPMSPKIGGPEWFQAWQAQNPSAVADGAPRQVEAQAGQQPLANLTQKVMAGLASQADIRAQEGDIEGANKLYEQAVKYMPEVNRIEASLDPKTNQPINVIYFKDGRQEVSKYGPSPKIHFADDGQSTAIPVNEYTGTVMGAGIKRHQTPDSRAVDVRAAADRAASGDVAIPFSPDAIKNAAARYNLDGTLPPMGLGKSAMQVKATILNEAAVQKAGVSGEQQRLDQLNNKGDVAARNAAVRSFSTGKDGQAIQAANTALNHLETIEQLAKAQGNGDTQAFNALANRLAAATGQPAPTNLRAAITMVAPEVSKSVIGAAGGQEERAQFAKNFNPDGSVQQTLQGVGVIKELMGGRLSEAQRTYQRSTKRDDFSETMLSPAAQKVLAQARQHANPTGGDATPPAGGQFSIQAPNGKTFYFKTAKDLANFKLTAGIR